MKRLPIAAATLLLNLALSAQQPVTQILPSNDTGVGRVGSLAAPLGSVSAMTGNLSMSIPLLGLNGRGKAGYQLALQYDSKIWDAQTSIENDGWDAVSTWGYQTGGVVVGKLGWHLNLPFYTPSGSIFDQFGNVRGRGYAIVTLPDGSKHTISEFAGGLHSEDGLALMLGSDGSSEATVTTADGTIIHYAATNGWIMDKLTDSNGNYVTFSASTGVLKDSAGHSVTLHLQAGVPIGSGNYYTTAQSIYDCDSIDYTDADGNLRTITFTKTALPLLSSNTASPYYTGTRPFASPVQHMELCGSACARYTWAYQPSNSQPYSMLTSLSLPDGSSYGFSYNGWGEATKIIFPGGGYARYDYHAYQYDNASWDGYYHGDVVADFREVTAQYTCPQSECSTESVTTYNPTIDQFSINNSASTVTTPVGDYSQFTYTTAFMIADAASMRQFVPQEHQRLDYARAGTLLKRTDTSYLTYDGSEMFPSRISTFLCTATGGALNTVKDLAYDTRSLYVMRGEDAYTYPHYLTEPVSSQTSAKLYHFTSVGSCLTSATSLGSALRTDTTNYISNSTYDVPHIFTLPSQHAIYDGSTLLAQETYAYDESSVTATSAAQHQALAPTVTARGNPTTITKVNNVGPSSTSTLTYYDTGSLKTVTSPPVGSAATGMTTTYVYGDGLYLYPTSISNTVLPGSSIYTYYAPTGQLHTAIDRNNNQTTYNYDLLFRPSSVVGPPDPINSGQSGQVRYVYASPTLTEQFVKQSSTVEKETDTLYDGLGRVVDIQLHDPSGACSGGINHTKTSYDLNGRVSSVSNPYCMTGESTYGLTGHSYDGLGRPTQITHPDASSEIFCYNGMTTVSGVTCSATSGSILGFWSDSFDEANVHTLRTTDAGDRLRSVYELGTLTSPFNLQTTYTYSATGNLVGVNQAGATGDTARARSFIYDNLSHLITSSSPETGIICYGIWSGSTCANGYDASGNLLAKTDARGVVSYFHYDALNRLDHKWYSDGTTPQWFGYDGKNEDGTSMGGNSLNAIGRLSTTSNKVNVASIMGYDPMGRLKTKQDCVPGNCWNISESANYDLAGNLTSMTYPDGRTVTQGFDAAGRMNAVNYDNWAGIGPAVNYLTVDSTQGYDPAGHLTKATFGNGVLFGAGYDNRERVQTLAYGPSTAPLWSKQYAWTPNSNLQSTTDLITGVQRQFGYDGLNRLTSAQDIFSSLAIPSGSNGNTGSTTTSGSGATQTPGATGAVPWLTNPDDSNLLSEIGTPDGSWLDINTTVVPNAFAAPDGSMTAALVTATSGSADSGEAGKASSPSSLTGETVTGSIWLRTTSGTQTINLYITTNSASGFAVPGTHQVQLTTSWQQFSVSGYTGSMNLNEVRLQIGGGGTFTSGQTFLMWNPMLEDSGSAGSSVTNILPYSQRFSTWTNSHGTTTDNTVIAPDGSNTGTTLQADMSGNANVVYDIIPNPAPLSGMQVTGSVWLKVPYGTVPVLLTFFEVGSSGGNPMAAQTVNLTTTWQRFQVTGTTQSMLNYLVFQIGGAQNQFINGQYIQAWGAQVELAAQAGPYVATGATPVTMNTSMVNLFPYSQQPNRPGWGTYQAILTSTTVAAPDGSMTASQMTQTTGSTNTELANGVANPGLYDGATLTASIFLQSAGGAGNINLYLYGITASGTTYMGSQAITMTGTWQRFSVVGTTPAPTNLTALRLQVGDSNVPPGQVYNVWGAQLEYGSHPGPYIPTNSLPMLTGRGYVNLLPQAQPSNGPSWGMVNTTTAVNTDTAPDGTHTAATLTPGSGQAYVDDYIANPSLYDQQTVTASVYLRTTGSNSMSTVLAIGQESGSLWSAVAQNTITVTPQWQRFEVTGQTLNGLMQLYMQIGTGGFTSGATLEMWGAQFVVGLSAGPYSPTAGDTTTVIATGQQGTLVPTGLNEAYAYDSFGNILQNGPSNAFYTANNQMFGYAYDAAGNLLSNGVTPLTWDAESRLTSAAGATYIYDAMGNRVEKQGVGVTDTIYFGGRPIARFSAGQWTDLIYGPNGLLAEVAGTQTAQPTYRLLDHLGTEVGQTDASAQLINPLDYRPFGGVFSGNTNDPYLFTGKERDAESGLDNFGARYFGSSMGRFMSPDFGGPAGLSHPDPVPWADLENPQTLNLYSYGNNNPVSNADDDGHDVNICDNNGNCHQVSNEEYQKAQQGNNGGLNVPTLDQVGSNGNGSGQFNATAITDSNGNTVGTATYVSNGNLDYYANANGYQQLSAASTVVKGATVGVAVTFGAVGVGMVAADIALGSELTTLGDIGTTPTSGQLSQAEQVLQQSGKKGVEKAIRTLEKRVAQHLEKLDQFQRTGGYTSKTTSEIQNFQSLIRAYQSVLK